MEQQVGEKRKEGSRGRALRGEVRSGEVDHGSRETHRPRTSTGGRATPRGRRSSSAAQVIDLHERRRSRRGGTGGSARTATGGSSTGNATLTVGHRRLRMVAAAFAVVGLLLGGRAVQMSATSGEQYQAFAAEQHAGDAQTATRVRGSIVSADGRELATSLEAARVVATPYQIREPANAARALAGVIGPETGLSAAEIERSLTKKDANDQPSGYSVVASGLKPETGKKVGELGIAGISVVPDTVRVYPERSLASQLLGHVGEYGEPFGGVEARYNGVLKSGKDVTLTLDTAVQQQLQNTLEGAVEESEAKSGVGLVMRVQDGAIVALANIPGYNNNNFSQAPVDAQRDRVLTDPYEPGSTFKAFTVSSALEEGAVAPDSTFVVPDHVRVADRVVHDSLPHETEVMTPKDVLEQSSNVRAIKIAQSLGGAKLYEYIKRFGFGEPTGVDLWGEDPGSVPAYQDWSGSSIGNLPEGQGLTVTPLQLASG